MEQKSPFLSKTLWMALIAAIAAFIPVVSKFISEQPEMYGLIMSGLFGALRLISKDKISIT